ncbi:hypothetical protein [Nocardia africana]|uniref:Transmembrane protein n=1 Tax=Nocardia africana TaxID=134964 RepID=A0A378WW06_9NOCA|nr:hypothetical protein [Nocardia africana]MCC3313813.1 hypothetical protein [Nocardia africana]SUA44805.1 Uncharacterised protein [Nocardia africana]
MARYLAEGFGARWAVPVVSAPEHVPAYTPMQVWIGTAVVLVIVVATLAAIGWMILRGRVAQHSRHRAHRRS